MYSRCTVQTTCVPWLKGPEGSRRIVSQNTFTHPRVMFHLAPHNTLNTSTSSLSPTSPVLLSSASPDPDLLSTHPFIHCEDPRQDGTSAEFHSSTVSLSIPSQPQYALFETFISYGESCLTMIDLRRLSNNHQRFVLARHPEKKKFACKCQKIVG